MPKWIWDPDRQALVAEDAWRACRTAATATYVMPDIAEFRSPIDGAGIGSRSTLRAHEQRHGVRQCGELKTVGDFDNRRLKPFRSALPE